MTSLKERFCLSFLRYTGRKKKVLEVKSGKRKYVQKKVFPEKIRLLDLIEIFQGKFKLSECLFKKKICPNQISCKLREQLDSLEELVENKIKEITLASLLNLDN